MKFPILALILAIPLGAEAQSATNALAPSLATNSAQAPTMPPPRKAASTTTPDNSPYVGSPGPMLKVEANLAAIQGKPCDIIFIGASIIAGWQGAGAAIWQKDYLPRHALNFGVPGDKTQNVLWRLDNMNVKELRPKVAVIMIGANNTANTPREIADGIQAVVNKARSIFPGVKVILVSLTPNRRGNDKMMAVDTIIKGFADDQSVYWLDLVPLMPPIITTTPNGKTDMNWKGLKADHLHPNASGYQIWHDAMEPLLSKLLAGG